MNTNKIAILVDSGTNVPAEFIEKYNMFSVPLLINYKDGEYRDGIDITAQEVFDRFKDEIPKTSLPLGDDIKVTLNKIKDAGYTKVIIPTISTGLSGTHNTLRLIVQDFNGLDCRLIDTKNIGIGAGFNAIRAGELIEKGLDIDELEQELLRLVAKTKIFYCVDTLEYLRKGGRIGLVAGTVGSFLGIKPIISCNEDGVYYTVKKSRSRKLSLEVALEQAIEFAGDCKNYNLAVVYTAVKEEAKEFFAKLCAALPNANETLFGDLCPSLTVHVGPGLIGVCVQKLD